MASNPQSCTGALNAAVKGAFSKAEVDAIAERMVAAELRAKQKKPSLSRTAAIRQAAADLTLDEVKGALIRQRMAAKKLIADDARAADLRAMTGKFSRRIEALNLGDEVAGTGGLNSADSMGHALSGQLVGDIERGLRAIPGAWQKATAILRDIAHETDVAREMARLNGGAVKATGNTLAEASARVLVDALEKARVMQNDAGAYIGQLDGYITRQSHDPVKVGGGFFGDKDQVKAFNDWYSFILPRLDERSFDDIMPTGNGKVADRRAFLQHIFDSIVGGRHEVFKGARDAEGYVAPSAMATRLSANRVLHFASPDAWMEYHNAYARGSLFGAVAKQLDRAGRNSALMLRWGPNPEDAFKREIGRAMEAAVGDPREIKALGAAKMQGSFDQISGAADAPENLKLAMVGGLLRKHESVAKLGGMVLSAFGDIPVAASALMRAGVPFLDSYGAALSGITRLDGRARRMAAEMLDVGSRAATGKLTSGVTVQDGALGFYTVGARINMQIQGFEFWNDGLRSGVGSMFAKHLGDHAGADFNRLPKALQASFARYGIAAADWDVIRQGVQVIEGKRFVTADHISDARLALKTRQMVQDVLDVATSESRGREQRALTLNGIASAGTPFGEAWRALTQFMSFPMTYINRSLVPTARDAFTGGPVMPLVNLILGTTLFGFASLNAKELTKGHEPRPLNTKSVLAAMVQGGGLGIYGDFLFGEKSRMGGGLAETFGGPIVGDAAALYGLVQNLRDGALAADADKRESAREQASTGAFRLLKGQIPLANLWYTRAALDYLLFWRAQEALDPGWAARYQRRVEKENGAEFWLKPTDAIQ